jgi:hypothetical protein
MVPDLSFEVVELSGRKQQLQNLSPAPSFRRHHPAGQNFHLHGGAISLESAP